MASEFLLRAARLIAWRCNLAVLTTATGFLVGMAAIVPSAEAAGRHAAMVIDGNTGQVLHAQAADEARYPASLTKMMTLYIVFELMEQGRIPGDARIRVSEEAARVSPSKLGLEPGSEIAVMDAIKSLITKSANDISVALAEHVAGSEAKFAVLMNRKARQLGMSATTFRNAHGLPDSQQVTTARDMLTLALRLNDDFPRYYKLFGMRSFSYGGATYRNHNTLLNTYRGMDGLKTGYTGPAGFNLVASVRRDGKYVVSAVFGGSSASARNAHMRTILDRALAKASTERTRAVVASARGKRPERNESVAAAPQQAPPQLVETVARVERRPAVAPVVSPPSPVASAASPVAKARSIEAAPRFASASTSGVPVANVRPMMIAPRAKDVSRTEPVAAAAPSAPEAGSRLAAFTQPAAAMPPGAGISLLGAQPSSLQEQARRIENGKRAVETASVTPRAATVAVKPTARPQGTTPAESVAIQIGAYLTEAEAQKRLASLREKSPSILANASPSTQVVQSAGRQLYRARFVGLDASSAAAACTELRRNQVDCQVTR